MKTFRLYRIIVIVSLAIRFFLQVYVLQRKWRNGGLADVSAEWERLLVSQAKIFRAKALQLEGLLIKVGQFLSTRADVLPRVFTNELKDLVDRVPPAPWKKMKRVLLREWNVPLEQVLADIETVPVASASIADVYRATLRDGSKVAIKIRRPNVARLISADLAALKIVVKLARRFTNWGSMADLDALYRDFAATTLRELDFRQERQHAERFRAMIDRLQLTVRAPACYEQWSTEQVLLMQWIDGASISDNTWLQRHGVDRAHLITQLIDASFAQVFDEGFFHADPHPGNLLVSADGTLHFIDFGMVGSIRPEVKKDLTLFLQGFIARDVEKMARAFAGLGFLRTGAEPLDLQTLIKTGIDFFLEKDFSRIDEQMMVEMLAFLREYIARNPLQLPAEFAFLGRTTSILSGVLALVEPQIDYLQAIKPAVAKWLDSKQKADAPNDDSSLFFNIGEWGKRTLAFFNNQALPRLVEFTQLPQKANEYMEFRKWNDYFAKRQQQTLIMLGTCVLSSTALVFSAQPLLAIMPAVLAVWPLSTYWREHRQWQMRLENDIMKNERERVHHD